MKYEKLVTSILKNVGGKDNITNVERCMTRLRVNVVDINKVEIDKIDLLDGVMGVVEKNHQVQIIIGNEIDNVYKDFNTIIGEIKENKSSENEQGNLFSKLLNTIAEIFNPIVPALAGAGMIKAFLVIVKLTNLLPEDSQTYLVINLLSDAAFSFLPILLAYSSSKRFKSNPYLAAILAATMLHPTFSSLRAEGIEHLNFMGLPLSLVNYSSSVIPIILGVLFMSYVEKIMDKVIPSFLKIVFVPALTLLVSIPIVLLTVGPFAQWLGNGIANGVTFLFERGGFLAGLIYGGVYSSMVVTGLHHGMVPVLVQGIATQGFNTISPASGSANMAQAGASFAVWLKSKQQKNKTVAAGATVSALLGVTEPAIYGVNLRLKKPFLAAAIGGAAGGAIAVGLGGKAYAMGGPSFATLPMFIGDDGGTWLYVLLGFIVAFIVAAIAAFILGFEEDIVSEKLEAKGDSKEISRGEFIKSPVVGELVPLIDVPDPTFSNGIIGDGFAVNPSDNVIVSPVDGVVMSVFKTGHAIGIKSNHGIEVLVHIGIDTVKLEGKYISCFAKVGDSIKQGENLAIIDREGIVSEGYSPLVLTIITNKNDFPQLEFYDMKNVNVDSEIMKVGI